MLAIVGEPKLSLLDASVGVALAILGEVAAGLLGFGSIGIAAASAASVIVSSVLALYWLGRPSAERP
jgi:hypothetical protein